MCDCGAENHTSSYLLDERYMYDLFTVTVICGIYYETVLLLLTYIRIPPVMNLPISRIFATTLGNATAPSSMSHGGPCCGFVRLVKCHPLKPAIRVSCFAHSKYLFPAESPLD